MEQENFGGLTRAHEVRDSSLPMLMAFRRVFGSLSHNHQELAESLQQTELWCPGSIFLYSESLAGIKKQPFKYLPLPEG